MLNDQIIAAIRTGCATLGTVIVLALVDAFSEIGGTIVVDESWAVALSGLFFALAVAGYNLAVNWLSAHVWPGFGYLLGVNKAPGYGGENG